MIAVIYDEALAQASGSFGEKLAAIAPVHTTSETYFGWTGEEIEGWGEVRKRLKL